MEPDVTVTYSLADQANLGERGRRPVRARPPTARRTHTHTHTHTHTEEYR